MTDFILFISVFSILLIGILLCMMVVWGYICDNKEYSNKQRNTGFIVILILISLLSIFSGITLRKYDQMIIDNAIECYQSGNYELDNNLHYKLLEPDYD